jgi:hypothetical protein
VHTNENHFLIALSRPRARTAPQAKPPPPNTTTRCGCSLGPHGRSAVGEASLAGVFSSTAT